MKTRAHVLVTAEPEGGELKLKSIMIASDPIGRGGSELVFEWFRMSGSDYAAAHKNCVESIAFRLHTCGNLILPFAKALAPALADEVGAAMGRIDSKWANRG